LLADKIHHGLARLMHRHGHGRPLVVGAAGRFYSYKLRGWGSCALGWVV
jgi:hypothetical protein